MLQRKLVCLALMVAMTAALAQAALPPGAPVDFPADAKTLTPEDLRQRLAGNVFHVPLADGSSLRLQYQAAGYYYVNTSRGTSVNGTWRADGTRLCTDRVNRGPACNEVRLAKDALHVKLDSGEVVRFEPR
jgi:hypothetical protein